MMRRMIIVTSNLINMYSNRKQLRGFIGKVSYYRRFIRAFAAIANPLLEKLKKSDLKDNEEFDVTPEMEKSFEELKKRLLCAPVLAHPRFDLLDEHPFIVTVDWSAENNAVGMTLEQEINGRKRVIAYGAKRLSPTQRSYSATKGELAACIIALDTWRFYLQLRPFVLRTDHAAITHLRNFKNPQGMAARWQQRLESFNFRVEHVKGVRNAAADALSRAEHLKYNASENLDPFEERDEVQTLNAAGVHLLEGDSWTPRMLRETQEEDPNLKIIRALVKKGEKPDREAVDVAPVHLKTYFGLLDSLYLDDKDVLRYRYSHVEHPGAEPTVKDLLVLPDDLAYDVILRFHEVGAHLAAESTAQRAMKTVYCHNLLEVARRVVRRCIPCQKARRRPKDQRHTLYSPRQGYSFQRVTVDYVGPLARAAGTGCRYILTCQCSLTRWVEAYAVKACTAANTLEILQREILSRYGWIENIHSDRGTHFTANAVRDACKVLNIPWTYTTAYNPKANRVESAHKTLGKMITALTEGRQDQWQKYLSSALFALRTNVNRSTGFAPYRLLFGRDPSLDIEIYFKKPNQPEEFRDYDDYAIKLKDRIQQATRWAQDNIGGAIRRQRRAYCQMKKKFQIGQKVWLFTPRRIVGQSSKYKCWWTGPWTVSRIPNDLTYELTPHPSWPRQGKEVVSIDRLAEYHSDETEDEVKPGEGEYAPSPGEDLSMEGDEHAEDIHLPYTANAGDSDSEDEYGFDVPEMPAPWWAPPAEAGPAPAAAEPGAEAPVDGEQQLEAQRDAQRVFQEGARARRPLVQPARFQPAPQGPQPPRPDTPITPQAGPHPQFGTGSPQFFTPGVSPREQRANWRQARREEADEDSPPPLRRSPRFIVSPREQRAQWRQERREATGEDPPTTIRRSPRLRRIGEEGEGDGVPPPAQQAPPPGREERKRGEAQALPARPPPAPTGAAPGAPAPPAPEEGQGGAKKKRGRPLAEREEEHRRQKAEEQAQKQRDADKREKEREERQRRREEKAKEKKLGKIHGYVPGWDK